MNMRIVFAGAFALLSLTAVSAQRRGGAARPPTRCRSASSVPSSATASRRSPACPAIRRSTTPAPRRAASGRRPTAASAGRRCSTACRSPRSARSRSRRPTRTSSGPAPAKRGRSATATSSATASTSRPTPARRGRTWASTRPAASAASSSIRRTPTSSSPARSAASPAPQQERGVFRTTDGGQHWERVLFVDENTGCSGLSMDAKNPRTLFAGTWQVEMHPWAMLSGGAGQRRLRVARRRRDLDEDRGRRACRKSPLGKIDVAVAPTDSNRVYALIQTDDQGSVWRSDDGGGSWRVVNWSRELIGRAGYYIHLAVSPATRTKCSSPTARSSSRSTAARRSAASTGAATTTTSGGIRRTPIASRSRTTPASRSRRSTAAARSACSCRSARCITSPSTTRCRTTSTRTCRTTARCADRRSPPEGAGAGYNGSGNAWDHGLGGCESGFTAPDPADPEHRLGDLLRQQGHALRPPHEDRALGRAGDDHARLAADTTRSTAATGRRRSRSIRSITTTSTTAARSSSHTNNGGQSWQVISPDLSTQDPRTHHARRAASSATTSGSSRRRWSSRSRRRRSRRG